MIYALNFPPWKRPYLASCLVDHELRWVRKHQEIPPGAMVAVWGRVDNPMAMERGWRTVQVEDGFIRSVGLGAELSKPASWVLDHRGIYFDATTPSDLEYMLNTDTFEASELARARALREFIVQAHLTKYNLGRSGWRRPRGRSRVLLVPGQVEADASIRYGSPQVRTNLELLQRVRARNPDAWIVFKAHPDVVSGFRPDANDISTYARWCDEYLTEENMAVLLEEVDEIHCITSLAGFEAMLRNVKVVCYGQPFYAGWGLTEDIYPHPRRRKMRQLDELVAAALIRYPRYFSLHTHKCVSPEQALSELEALHRRYNGRLPWWRLALRPAIRTIAHMRRRWSDRGWTHAVTHKG